MLCLLSITTIPDPQVSVAEGPSELEHLVTSALAGLREAGEKVRKQPVWSMRGVLEGLLGAHRPSGSRASLPPDLGDPRARARRSIKEVFKKRSV